jgi:DNA-binding NarL/FixJ family response regulator
MLHVLLMDDNDLYRQVIARLLESQPDRVIRVLLVDDNEHYRQVIARLLEREPDMEVVGVAGSLAEARAMLEGVEVALLDRTLPDGDGIELIGELREASPGAKVLLMSATMEQVHLEQTLAAGADGAVNKLEPAARLFAAVRELVGG